MRGQRTFCVSLLLCVLPFSSPEGLALDDGPQRFTRVRGADPEMRRLIAETAASSATFRSMVDEIQRSNGIVIVQFGFCRDGRFRSCVVSVEGDEQRRHIRILVSTRASGIQLMATIAHELWHAVEIVREPDVFTNDQTLALYRRLGTKECRERLTEACETEQALRLERVVLAELHAALARR